MNESFHSLFICCFGQEGCPQKWRINQSRFIYSVLHMCTQNINNQIQIIRKNKAEIHFILDLLSDEQENAALRCSVVLVICDTHGLWLLWVTQLTDTKFLKKHYCHYYDLISVMSVVEHWNVTVKQGKSWDLVCIHKMYTFTVLWTQLFLNCFLLNICKWI